ncbi:hypothetical protein AgCh_031074 [Apium graveolens]
MPPRRRGTRAQPAESVNQQQGEPDPIVNEESEEDLDYNEYDEEEYVQEEAEDTHQGGNPMNEFMKLLRANLNQFMETQMEIRFLELKQDKMTVAEYEAKFTELSRFVPEFVNTKEKKARRFQLGLKQWIQNRVAVLELTDYATLVQKASIVEAGSEQSVKEKENRKRKIGSQGIGTGNRSHPSRFVRGAVSQPARGSGFRKAPSESVGQGGGQSRATFHSQPRAPIPECQSYTKKEVPNIQDIPVVNKFEDVFPKNLPGLPPDREIEFAIELAPGTTPVSKAPYRLAPVEI